MSMLDGVSQCWWLSKTCVVNWNAWSAAGAIAAVVTTGVLGVFTYRLGKAANRASDIAVKIASSQANKQADRDETERLLVLVHIVAQVSANAGLLTHLIGLLNEPNAVEVFVQNKDFRDRVFGRLNKVSFSSVRNVEQRLHLLGRATSGRLARAVGLFELIQSSDKYRDGTETDDELRSGHGVILATLPLIVGDLRTVEAECANAVKELELVRSPSGITGR